MSKNALYQSLQSAKTEEDVKDIYIRALGLKKVNKGLVDIRTNEIWFEAKFKTSSTYEMFTQILFYVQTALKKGEDIPPFLAVLDREKAALMETAKVVPFLKMKTLKWGKSATQFPRETVEEVSNFIGTHLVSFKISTHEEEFIRTVKTAIKSGNIIRTQITPDNLKQVFDKWVDMIGREIAGVDAEDYNLLFFADIMSDGTNATHDNLPAQLLHKNGAPVFMLGKTLYELGNKDSYDNFWKIYHRPPEKEYRDYLLERRDSLIPLDERSFKGAYYTPLHVVDKAYDKLSEVLGRNWQKDYIVWDMCCGVGNLEVKHSNPRNIYMSTLDQADVDVMYATKTCAAATRFQYDYLNDDINDFGQIDYSLTNKMPQGLRDAIAKGKKILVLMNPPYAEASNAGNTGLEIGDENKTGVSTTKIGLLMKAEDYGYAARELFAQFIVRIAKEMPNATLATFSTLKYINASNFEKFRANWNAKYLGGFIVHSKAFDGLNGNFPIGFLVWKTDINTKKKTPITEIETEIITKQGTPIGEKKFFNIPNKEFLNLWIPRLKTDTTNIPLKNAVTLQNNHAKVTGWIGNSIGYMYCNSNDIQHAPQQTVIYSSVYAGGNGFYITPETLQKISVIFCVRLLTKHSWINHNDQFLQPTAPPPDALWEEFQSDCLVWMLFHGKNLTAGADGLEWNGRTWSLVNHFIPYTETEVGATARFESDFMVRYMADKKFSGEAQAVLDAGRELWRAYFSKTNPRAVRDELKLNRPDAGWYQIRNALKKRNEAGDTGPVDFTALESAYDALSEKLRPLVFEYGFLKD